VAWQSEAGAPLICLLIILVLVLAPSVRPLWCGRVGASVAWMSRSGPRAKERGWGRSAARASVIHCQSRASLLGSGTSRAGKDETRLARVAISGAGCGELLAGREAPARGPG